MMTPFFLLSTAAALLADEQVDLRMNPVTKVVGLLEDMRDSLEKEAKTDEELYEKLQCWCETNGGNKKEAIATAEKRIAVTTENIAQYSGKSAELKATIEKLNKEIAKNKDSLAKAAALRATENGEFSASEKELLQSISQVSGAVDSLSKHHTDAFLQVSATNMKSTLRQLSHKALATKQREQIESFLQQMPSSGSYSSRSGAIFGILEQMKETFESNLDQSRKDEATAQSEFEALKASKTAEINEGKAGVSAKTKELAETDEALVHAKHDLKKTTAALSADQKFLLDLEKRCSEADAEYADRRQMRNEELAGVSDALTILTDDSARDLFSSSLSFVQRSSLDQAKIQASSVLRKAGLRTQSAALMNLASSVRLDAFTKVKGAIDEMVTALKTEQQEEVDHQRFCAKELSKNEKGQAEKKQKIKDLTLSLEDMAATIDTLTKDIATLEEQVASANREIKHASEDREAENTEFQQTVADQRATQTILQKCLARLEQVYAKKSFVQVRSTNEPGAAAPPPPQGFGEYKQQPSGGVMALIQKIIAEANTLEKEALHAEQTSQSAYEDFIADSKADITAKNRAIAAKSSEKAELETASVQADGDKAASLSDLERLGKQNGDLHASCDFVLNNFEARQTARAEEIDALGQAKAILSGADFGF